ncbi:hypothetical protein ILUMI_14275, partial [Ignelater luminosus]
EPEEHLPTGRRSFDVAHLFRQLFSSGKHEPFDCDLSCVYVVKEVRKGLRSSFELKCLYVWHTENNFFRK